MIRATAIWETNDEEWARALDSKLQKLGCEKILIKKIGGKKWDV